MPWIGSAGAQTTQRSDGTRTGDEIFQEQKAASIKVRADLLDIHASDLNDMINDCLKKDGGNTATENIPMGGFLLTGAGSATARTHNPLTSQVQDSTALYAGTSSGTDTITATLSPAITAYVAGQRYHFKAGGTNTGAATINLNSVGAKDIKKGPDGATALAAGDITTGGMYTVEYDGTNMQLVNAGLARNVSAFAATILDDASASAVRTTIGVVTATESDEGLVEKATDAEIRAAATGAKAVMAEDLESAAAAVALTHASPTTIDWDAGINFTWAITGSVTLSNPSNGQPGTWRRLEVTQDATGSRVVTWGNQYVHPGGVDAVLSTAANSVDTLYIYCRTTSIFEVHIGGLAWAT